MGYYSYYTLSLQMSAGKIKPADIIRELREENSEAEGAIAEDGSIYDEATWYDCKKDMLQFSKKYPEVFFVLSCRACLTSQPHDEPWTLVFKDGMICNSDDYPGMTFYGTAELDYAAEIEDQEDTGNEDPPEKSEWETYMEQAKAARNRF